MIFVPYNPVILLWDIQIQTIGDLVVHGFRDTRFPEVFAHVFLNKKLSFDARFDSSKISKARKATLKLIIIEIWLCLDSVAIQFEKLSLLYL